MIRRRRCRWLSSRSSTGSSTPSSLETTMSGSARFAWPLSLFVFLYICLCLCLCAFLCQFVVCPRDRPSLFPLSGPARSLSLSPAPSSLFCGSCLLARVLVHAFRLYAFLFLPPAVSQARLPDGYQTPTAFDDPARAGSLSTSATEQPEHLGDFLNHVVRWCSGKAADRRQMRQDEFGRLVCVPSRP